MEEIENPVALVFEIISAIVALVAVIMMIVNLVQVHSAKKKGTSLVKYKDGVAKKSTKGAVDHKRHKTLGAVLVVAAVVHGASAMIYDSDAITATYVFGWIGAALIVVSCLVMVPSIRKKLGDKVAACHRGLFIAALVAILVHMVLGRL